MLNVTNQMKAALLKLSIYLFTEAIRIHFTWLYVNALGLLCFIVSVYQIQNIVLC